VWGVTLRKSSQFVALVLALWLLASCNGLATKNHDPFVFALNLSSASVSLALEKNEVVLAKFLNLTPMESRPLTRLEPIDGAVLRQGVGDQPAGTSWTDPSGTAYSLRFQTGHLYAIVVDPSGQAALYTLPETYSTDPKVCIVNVTGNTLSQVQAAPDWSKNVKVYAQDLVPVVPSEFYSIEPKTLGLYWQRIDQINQGGYISSLGPDGKPLRQIFEAGRFYLFLAGDGAVRDLTPTLD
jgi:hypothetical protein